MSVNFTWTYPTEIMGKQENAPNESLNLIFKLPARRDGESLAYC